MFQRYFLSDSEAWRKPYQDFQDLRIYRMGIFMIKDVNIDSQFNSEVDWKYLEVSQATATIRLNNVYEHES